MNHAVLVLTSLALTWVCPLAPRSVEWAQSPPANTQGVGANATVVVAPATQFAPTTWEFSVQTPASESAVLIYRPSIECHRFNNGTWAGAIGEPGTTADESGPQASLHSRLHIRLEGGQPVTMRWELSDWRVVAFPGEYRARVQWILGDERRVRYTDWAPFTVTAVPAEGAAAALLAAQTNKDDTWKAYKQFMNEPMDLLIPDRLLGSGSAEKSLFLGEIQARLQPAAARLRALSSLPAGVQRRLDMAAFIANARTAWVGAPGQARTLQINQMISDLHTFGANPDFYGALAKWQALVLTKEHASPEAFAAAQAEFAPSAVLMPVGNGMPRIARRCGLMSSLPSSGPGPTPPVQGPG